MKQVELSIKISKEDVILKKGNKYTSILLKDGIVNGNPGEPALPSRKFYASVPLNCIPGALEAVSSKTLELAADVYIEPCQPSVPTVLGSNPEWVSPDPKIYESDAVWPKTFARVTAVRLMGGFAVAEIEVCPFQYHPHQRKLELIESLSLKLNYTEKGVDCAKPQTLMSYKHEQKFAEKVKKLVLNPADVANYLQVKKLDDLVTLNAYPEIEYVIITTAALAESFHKLANWRSVFGKRARVVTVDDIVGGTVPDTGGQVFWRTNGYYDGGTRDTAEAIRSFIKWASVNWLTDYVLLGGDTTVIPVRKALHTRAGTVSYNDINIPFYRDKLGNLVTASTQKAGKLARNVADEDVNTAWECEAADGTPWIRYTLGEHIAVNCVKLTWGSSYATSFTVQTSMNGSNWTDVKTVNGGTGGTQEITFPCTSAKYIQIRITSGTNFSMTGFSVYGPRRDDHGGTAYRIGNQLTRIFTSVRLTENAANTADKNQILIIEGPHAGKIIPYNTAAGDQNPGWYFATDLTGAAGTISNTPTDFAEIRGPVDFHGSRFVMKTDLNYIPADLYYSDIQSAQYVPSQHHDWDKDDDGVYGERYGGEIDSVNGFADIYVGRASVENPQEANIFIDKLINYESYTTRDEFGLQYHMPADFAVSVLLGSQDYSPQNNPDALDGSAAGKEAIRSSFRSFDPNRWIFTRLYQDYENVPAADKGPDLGSADRQKLKDAINRSNNVVALSSHGSPGYVCYLYNVDMQDAANYPGIFYANSCSTNRFDTECLTEYAILNPKGGAIAFVGNTRFGWTSDGPIERKFWETMLTGERLGDMFNACKLVDPGWSSYSINLLGDPAMRVWSDRPKQINVEHPQKICTGQQTVTVRVTSGGSPVAGALVCLSMGDSLIVTGVSAADGKAAIAVAPALAGTMRVAVSGKNLIPYLGSIIVEKGEVHCPPAIICGVLINCKRSILCASRIIGCPPKIIGCPPKIGGCIPRINACPAIDPPYYHDIDEIIRTLGFTGIKELAHRADEPEVQRLLNKLIPETKKSVVMMLKQIREEEI